MRGVQLRNCTDGELVAAYQAGEPLAFNEIYRRYRRPVAGGVKRVLRDDHDVEEVAQEVWVKALRGLPSFGGDLNLGAWLSTIARNAALDRVRRERLASVSLDEVDPSRMVIADAFSALDDRSDLTAALVRIEPHYAAALRMRAFDDLTYDEMAARLETTSPRIKALLHRARSSLKRAKLSLSTEAA